MKYIIDTDPGIDDAIAIMLGVRNNLDIIGFTMASGNIPLEKSINNLKVIEDFLKINIPIFKGKQIISPNFNAQYAHGIDGLGYAVFPINKHRTIEKTYAENFIVKMSKKYQDDLTVVCLGPMTNLASALKKDKNLHKRLKHVVIMGTSYNNENPYLEFNVKIDPKAAQTVLSSGIEDIKVITHEIGINSFIEKDYIKSLVNSNDLVSRFVFNIAQKYLEFSYDYYQTPGIGTPDPTTIAAIIDPSIISYTRADIKIITSGPNIGQSNVILKDTSNILISTSFDINKFRKLFKDTFK